MPRIPSSIPRKVEPLGFGLFAAHFGPKCIGEIAVNIGKCFQVTFRVAPRSTGIGCCCRSHEPSADPIDLDWRFFCPFYNQCIGFLLGPIPTRLFRRKPLFSGHFLLRHKLETPSELLWRHCRNEAKRNHHRPANDRGRKYSDQHIILSF